MYEHDERIVMTLDAGGTNFVFSAIRGCKEIVSPVGMRAVTDNLEGCLEVLVRGFEEVLKQLSQKPVAISFAFPGPADYKNGVIGDLPNLSAFRGGVALGAYLRQKFHLPVFINNDGNLFAYGEAFAGALPAINKMLETAGSPKRYRNLLGITLGTGFGGGVVIHNELLSGDNGCGGDLWVFRNYLHKDKIAEESVSIRAVTRVYKELSGDERCLTPKDIYEIAEGTMAGNRAAAVGSFSSLGKAAGDAVAYALTIIDGIVVMGGGLSGASKYIMPSFLEVLRGKLATFSGALFPRLQMEVFDLDDAEDLSRFLSQKMVEVPVPEYGTMVSYDVNKYAGVMKTKLTTNVAISVGAYVFALNELDKNAAHA